MPTGENPHSREADSWKDVYPSHARSPKTGVIRARTLDAGATNRINRADSTPLTGLDFGGQTPSIPGPRDPVLTDLGLSRTPDPDQPGLKRMPFLRGQSTLTAFARIRRHSGMLCRMEIPTGPTIGFVIVMMVLGEVFGLGVLALLAYWAWQRGRRRLEEWLGQSPRVGPSELLYSLSSWSLRELALTAQRATTGRPAISPMEPPLGRAWLDEVRFDPATITPPAASNISQERIRTVLGPQATRPVTLAIPLILSGMGWGVGVSGRARQALAEASALTGIGLNSGEGPVWPPEPQIAKPWIWQWSRARWQDQRAIGFRADMIELQIGQASEGGIVVKKPRRRLPPRVRQKLAGTGPFVIHGGLTAPLVGWVQSARRVGRGCPVGVKIPATHHVEEDLMQLTALGIDVITLDGAGAGTSGSPAVLTDHQSIPIAVAIVRAHDWLVSRGQRSTVSLVASGHVHSAADIAKLMALGADAVALGSVALLALTHGQVSGVLPGRGPTSLIFSGPGDRTRIFDRDLAAERLISWVEATEQELKTICASVGVTDIRDLGRHHLVTDTREAAIALGLAWHGDRPNPLDLNRLIRQLLNEWHRGLKTWAHLSRLLASPRKFPP